MDTDRTRNARRTPSILHDSPAVYTRHHNRRQTTTLVFHPRGPGWSARVCDEPTCGRAHLECTCMGGGSVPSERRRGVKRGTGADRGDRCRVLNAKTEQICRIHRDPRNRWSDTSRTVYRERSHWVCIPEPLEPPHSYWYDRNCPKYINVRDFVSATDTHPHVVYRRLDLAPNERLPDDVISFIHSLDTLFLGTYYDAGEHSERFPSHVGMNQRGGKPGFARVRPSDGQTLVIPDYSGTSIESAPHTKTHISLKAIGY